jgi:hypothetical protein
MAGHKNGSDDIHTRITIVGESMPPGALYSRIGRKIIGTGFVLCDAGCVHNVNPQLNSNLQEHLTHSNVPGQRKF